MRGWLVVNGFIGQNKFYEIYSWLTRASAMRGVGITRVEGDALLFPLGRGKEFKAPGFSPPDFVLFWDKDVTLARMLELYGLRLFNSARAVELCDDKAKTHVELEKNGIPAPKTIIAPMTFEGVGYGSAGFLENVAAELGLPLVVKERFGSFGKQVYLAENMHQLGGLVRRLAPRPMVFQEYIKNARDIRIQVVGQKIVASMRRQPAPGDFRANISAGGSMHNYSPTADEKALALEAAKALGVDFAGVDLIIGDRPMVCEVNSNAHFKNIYDLTGVNTAEHIIEYVLKRCAV